MSDKPERAQSAEHGKGKDHARGAACEENKNHCSNLFDVIGHVARPTGNKGAPGKNTRGGKRGIDPCDVIPGGNPISSSPAAGEGDSENEAHACSVGTMGAIVKRHSSHCYNFVARGIVIRRRVDPLPKIPPPLCSPRARPHTRKRREAQAQARPIACRPATWAESTSTIPYFGDPARS